MSTNPDWPPPGCVLSPAPADWSQSTASPLEDMKRFVNEQSERIKQTTGKTTGQMQRAPQGALYVWHCADLAYPTELAAHLGRNDLRIVPPSHFRDGHWQQIRQRVVIDHYTVTFLLSEQRDFYTWDRIHSAYVINEERAKREPAPQPEPAA